ncbi:YcaO-like family protein [Actinomyces ruminicola]|uniref:YcaO-like family protein n=1 Tax=Actinomyces ruminicola TaxID=332524 RepID=UPI00164F8B20|nr:YcaO-like family protein [Actinomyces ruminicola]
MAKLRTAPPVGDMMTREELLSGEWTDLRQTEPALDVLASTMLGVCREVVDVSHLDDDVRAHYAGANSSTSLETLGHECNSSNGGGAFSQRQARSAAIAETLERYSAAYMDPERMILASWTELDDQAVDPSTMSLFAPWQYEQPHFPFKPFGRDTRVRWVDAYDLRRQCKAWVPSQVVYLNSDLDSGEERVVYSTSNGLAAGPTRREALASGLLELVERDPLMITWYAMLSLPKIDLTSTAVSPLLEKHFAPTGLEFAAIDMSGILGVPTALGVVRNIESDVGALALGAASRASLRDAVVEALLEAFQTRTWCKSQQVTSPRVPVGADLGDAIVNFDAHVRYYGERDRAAAADFLTASDETVQIDAAPRLDSDTPGALVESVLRAIPDNIDVYAVDVTSPDIDSMGLSVIKVFSPQLQPLDVGWRTRMLGGRRIYDVPRAMGLAKKILVNEDLNPAPHPFP